MKTKNFYKFACIILVVAGMSFVAVAHTGASKDADVTLQDDNKQDNNKVVTVDKTVHDFGTFAATDGPKSATFVITNNTSAPNSDYECKSFLRLYSSGLDKNTDRTGKNR
jgi:predicted nuclease of predicted toxin-antitoxin system